MNVIADNRLVLFRLSSCTVTLTRNSGRSDRNTSMKYLRRSRRAHTFISMKYLRRSRRAHTFISMKYLRRSRRAHINYETRKHFEHREQLEKLFIRFRNAGLKFYLF
jgi:hypothetical protein